NQRLKEIGMQTPSASPSTQSMANASNHTADVDLFTNTTGPPSTNSMPNLTSDLFDLQPAFIPAVQGTPISTASSAWGGVESSTLHPITSIPTMNVDFDAVFGTRSSNSDTKPSAGYDAVGDLLKPMVAVHNQAALMAPHQGSKLMANDLDSSLAHLVGNLQFGGTPGKKSDMQWSQPGEKKLTGGNNWQSKTMSSTTGWTPAPLPPAAMPPAAMPVPHMAPAPMAFPMTTPQVPVYGMVPPPLGQIGGIPVMTQQPMLYNQPVLRPTNPFTTIPGAQMQFM
ncbi:hypothetical protein DNTS_004289, partial [Danionella cerebrum]